MTTQETFLKTRQVADALGVSVSSIKRWVDSGEIEATRTLGKHRLVLLSSALQFARREKFSVENLMVLAGHPAVEAVDDRLCETILECLRQGRVREAGSLIVAAYEASQGAVALADNLIRPLMQKIGHGWMVGAWDIYQEHQATQMVTSIIAELNGRLGRQNAAKGSAPLAMGAAPEGDIYVLPSLLGELVLREVGWEVRNLGGNLPLKSLAAATREYRPRLVFLSASLIEDRAKFLQDYSYFYEAATQVQAAIILGGRALDSDLRARLVYASFGDRMAHLAEFARSLLPSIDPTVEGNPLTTNRDR